MGTDIIGTAFVIAALLVVPAGLCLAVTRKPAQIVLAFAAWYLVLFLVLGGPSLTAGEGAGWTLIIGLFTSWAGVPLTALISRATGFPGHLLRR